jgi:hypothetical protein
VITLLQLDEPFEGMSPTCVTTIDESQMSDVVTELVFGAGTWEKHWTLTAPGQVIDGGVVSMIVMTCVQGSETLPEESVPIHVRMIAVPAQFVMPAASVWLNVTGLQSIAVGVPVADGSVDEPHSTLTLGGHVITGGVVSVTMMSLVHIGIAPMEVTCESFSVNVPTVPTLTVTGQAPIGTGTLAHDAAPTIAAPVLLLMMVQLEEYVFCATGIEPNQPWVAPHSTVMGPRMRQSPGP